MDYALVTGASNGIGAEFARLFAGHGIGLVLSSSPSSRHRLASYARQLANEFGVDTHALSEDLSLPGGAARLVNQIDALGLPIGYLVNNAGVGIVGLAFQHYELSQMTAMLQVNVVALSELTLQLVPRMITRGRGRVLNVSSSAGYVVPHALEAAYAASKAYVISASESIAYDLRDTGVTCTHLAPGPTRTNFFARAGLIDERRMEKLGYSEPAEIAKIGYAAMMQGQVSVMPGLSNKIVTWLARISPSNTLTGKISGFVVARELD